MESVRAHCEIRGEHIVAWSQPQTLAEVLQWEVEVCVLWADEDVVPGINLAAMITWLQRYVKVDNETPTAEQLSTLYGVELAALGRRICASARLPSQMKQELGALLRIIGGAEEYDPKLAKSHCGCRLCVPEGEAPEEVLCRFADVSTEAKILASLAMVAEEPALLQVPPWLVDIASERRAVAAEAIAAREQAKEAREKENQSAADIQREILGEVKFGPLRGT